jgi:hypothetical protein
MLIKINVQKYSFELGRVLMIRLAKNLVRDFAVSFGFTVFILLSVGLLIGTSGKLGKRECYCSNNLVNTCTTEDGKEDKKERETAYRGDEETVLVTFLRALPDFVCLISSIP